MLRVSTRTFLLMGFALAATGCFSADHAAATDGSTGADGGGGDGGGGDGGDGGGGLGTPRIEHTAALAGVGDNELRVAAGDTCGLAIAGSLSRDATFGEQKAGVIPPTIALQGTPDEEEIVMAGLEDDLSIRWSGNVFAASGGIELRDLAVDCAGSLALLVGDASTTSTITFGVAGVGTFECGRTFVLAVDVATGAPRWAHCAGAAIKYQGVAIQDQQIAVAGKVVTGSGDDAYIELRDIAGDLTGHTYTAGDAGNDKISVIAGVKSGGFIAGGTYDGEDATGDDGMIYVVNGDLTAGGRTVLGSIASASDDEVTAVGAATDVLWVAGTLGGGGILGWPATTSTGYSADAFVGSAGSPGTSPEVIAGFASTRDNMTIRALEVGTAVTIAGDYEGAVIDDAGTTHPGGTSEWPFFARLAPSDGAVTAWVPLTDDAGTSGRVTSITRAGGKVWLGGHWTGSLRAPDASVLASDQDGFLIEVTGL